MVSHCIRIKGQVGNDQSRGISRAKARAVLKLASRLFQRWTSQKGKKRTRAATIFSDITKVRVHVGTLRSSGTNKHMAAGASLASDHNYNNESLSWILSITWTDGCSPSADCSRGDRLPRLVSLKVSPFAMFSHEREERNKKVRNRETDESCASSLLIWIPSGPPVGIIG